MKPLVILRILLVQLGFSAMVTDY